MEPTYCTLRTTSANQDFINLVILLDKELKGRYGKEQEFFAKFNSIENIQHVIVLYANERPAGCGAFRPYDSVRAEIKRMFVMPEWRGRGLGRRIMTALEMWASEQFGALILETGIKQPEAIRLYKQCGYTQIPNFSPYENVSWSICMQKDLRPIVSPAG